VAADSSDRGRGRFAGRVALVTGASSGIGRAVALAIAGEGAAVGAVARTAVALEEVVAEIEAAGGRALALPGDIGVEAEVERAVATLSQTYGGLDVVANVAGSGFLSSVVEMSEADWDGIQAVNAKSCFLLAKHAVPEMRKRGRGAVVNVSSIYATAAVRGASAYAAAKGTVEAFTRIIALDHAAEGIRFNVVVPGAVQTPAVERNAIREGAEDPAAVAAAFGQMMPLARLIQPEEVAHLVLFLLSDQAAAITGGAFPIDGGFLARINTDTAAGAGG
jgi:meso-butanediol dehydrogenase/(S,S)-butanediol dehydrogenase/diacetyl reductase